MALVDDAVNVLKWSGKTALWGFAAVVGLRVLVPLVLPYCKPLVKGAAEGYAALRTRLQSCEGAPPATQETAEQAMTGAAATPAGKMKPHVVAPAKKKAAEAAPAKTKIAKLRPYQQWSKAELYRRAKELDIPGRSSMNKAELVKAIRAAGK